jgi:Protein of unknown function (DUF3551)
MARRVEELRCQVWKRFGFAGDLEVKERSANEPQRRAVMRAIGLVSVGLMMITLPVTDAAAASNAWCAVYNRRGGTSENCGYATLNQCRAQVLGLGGWCRPNPCPGTAFGTSRTWSAGPPPQRRGGY